MNCLNSDLAEFYTTPDDPDPEVNYYGLCTIDIYTLRACCIPMPSKTSSETVKAFKKTFAFYGDVYPYQLQTDEGKN